MAYLQRTPPILLEHEEGKSVPSSVPWRDLASTSPADQEHLPVVCCEMDPAAGATVLTGTAVRIPRTPGEPALHAKSARASSPAVEAPARNRKSGAGAPALSPSDSDGLEGQGTGSSFDRAPGAVR